MTKKLKCPQCGNDLEYFEEEEETGTRYTCNKCGVFIDIVEIESDEVLEMIGYSEDGDDDE